MTKTKIKYPCGLCFKKVSKTAKAVLCKNNCFKWYHLKCSKISTEEYDKVQNSNFNWTCEHCLMDQINSSRHNSTTFSCNIMDMSLDNELEDSKVLTLELNKELTVELENVNEVVNTLKEDIAETYKENKLLKNRISQLESMVLQREEEIVLLKDKLNEINKINVSRLNIEEGEFFSSVTGRQKIVRPSSTASKNRSVHANLSIRKPQEEISFISSNRYQALASLNDDSVLAEEICSLPHSESKSKNKILICADSHGRELSWHVNKCQQSYEAIGFVKPGGKTSDVLDQQNILQELTNKSDILVILCGTNDVAKNEAEEAVTKITDVLKVINDKKIILVDIPNRYDLPNWSCVNKETRKTNMLFHDIINNHDNVTMVEASRAERHLHTRHGMHFNFKGKRWLAEEICKAVRRSSSGCPVPSNVSVRSRNTPRQVKQPTQKRTTPHLAHHNTPHSPPPPPQASFEITQHSFPPLPQADPRTLLHFSPHSPSTPPPAHNSVQPATETQHNQQ